jgi:aspartate ammonia-lyase
MTKNKLLKRTETDFLGARELPAEALYGIHSLRAKENFPDNTPFHPEWYKAIGLVKHACYLTIEAFEKALEKQEARGIRENITSTIEHRQSTTDNLISASLEVSQGLHFSSFIVPAIQGGAGTSINMNVNEIIANVALVKTGHEPGKYDLIDPVEDANRFQSTNDVIPTSLKIAAMFLLNDLETTINSLRSKVEELENKHRNDLRTGYTQMQEAVPTSFGKLFSAYSEALSRDWWRVSKCFERIKQVNLGGGAVGTGLAIPRFFIMESINQLQKLTGLPVTRSENLADTTSNLDPFVEVHATLKAHAVNLEKMVGDIRILSSDIAGIPHPVTPPIRHCERSEAKGRGLGRGHLSIPQKQAGSSIMPGKVNPVIPEFVISSVHKIYANDQLITSLCGQGCLELNAYLPVIGHALLESLKLLIACDNTLKTNLFDGLQVNSRTVYEHMLFSPSITTALIPYIGYHKAGELANFMKENGCSVTEANTGLKLVKEEILQRILLPENLLKLGYSVNDLEEFNG